MGRTLVILEVSRKQDYIFSKQRLRENIRRSAEIAYITSDAFFAREASGIYSREDHLVYAGGGHTILQFDTQEQATAFAQQVTWAVLERFPEAELFVKQMPYDNGKTPGENLRELSRQLERKKALRRGSFRTTTFGVENLEPEKKEYAPVEEVVQPPEHYQFFRDYEEAGGEDSFLAVVHIDGNAMGKRVDRVRVAAGGDWAACCQKLRNFSTGVQRDFETAFDQLTRELVAQGRAEETVLPIRPVILAGDDVCFVVAGNLGLECARLFLEKLAALRNPEDGKPYAACAGVALVHQKYPFYQAYRLAEELCSNAKRFAADLDPSGSVSAMDWHIEFGQFKGSLEQIRADYCTQDGGVLSLRPVTVVVPEECQEISLRSYEFLRSLCQALQGESGKIARGKIKQLRTALKQGEEESAFFLRDKEISHLLYHAFDAEYSGEKRWEKYVQLLTQGGAMEKKAFCDITVGGRTERYCLFFDAVEMMDHWEFLKEVEV